MLESGPFCQKSNRFLQTFHNTYVRLSRTDGYPRRKISTVSYDIPSNTNPNPNPNQLKSMKTRHKLLHPYHCNRPSLNATHQPKRYNSTKIQTDIPFGTIPIGGKGMKINQYADLYRRFTVNDISTFGHLVGDLNPIHIVNDNHDLKDNDNPTSLHSHPLIRLDKESQQMIPVVHGQLISSLASSIFGTLISGAIYRSQNLVYRKPVYANDLLHCRLVIEKLRPFQKGVLVICDMTVWNYGVLENDEYQENDEKRQVCVDGEVKVWIPNGTES